MMGRRHVLAILLALGSGRAEAQTSTVVETPADEETAARQADVVDRYILSQTQTITLSDCSVSKTEGCNLQVFVPPRYERACLYDALVTEKILTGSGETAYVHLTTLVVQPISVHVDGKDLDVQGDENAVAVSAGLFFSTPGFHRVCFLSEFQHKGWGTFRIYRGPLVADQVDPIYLHEVEAKERIDTSTTANLFGEVGGFRGYGLGGKFSGKVTEGRLPYFQKSFRTFTETVGCALTGCPEKLAVSVTVRGAPSRLPIFQNNNPTPYNTDATIMVPRNQLQTLSVKYPDGTLQKVIACSKLQETRVSASFLCTKAE